MLKVSFKDKEGHLAKTVETFKDKETIVTLRGEIHLPKFWRAIPRDICDWIDLHQSVYNYESIVTDSMIITVKGTSKCNDGETFDPVLGERIAEARAKIKLYRFMYTLCKKLYKHYFTLIFSDEYYNQKGGMRHYHPNRHGGIYEEIYKYNTLLTNESHHLEELLENV